MNALFAAHSGLRYLVLLAGLVAVVYFALGLAQKRPYTRAVRTVGAIFSGLMDLQILLGLILVLMGRYYPQLIGHIVLMVLAAVVVHVLLAKNRKRAQPGYALPLAGVVLGLVLLVAGILAIRPSIFFMTRL
jgi:cbb3-type cytochrome oxidase subunit 3